MAQEEQHGIGRRKIIDTFHEIPHFGCQGRSCRVQLLRGLLTKDEVDALVVRGSRILDAAISKGKARSPEAVDGRPTFSVDLASDPKTREVLVPLVRDELSPYLRATFKLPSVELCEARFRRLVPNERRVVPAHQSFSGLVTCHINLQDAGKFRGGFFWLDGSTLERTEPALGRGDALAHRWDLLHGLEVREGECFELTLSFKDSFEAVRKGTCPWFFENAQHVKEAPEEFGRGLSLLADGNFTEALDCIVEGANCGYPEALATLAEWCWEPPSWLESLRDAAKKDGGHALPQEVLGECDALSHEAIRRWRQAAHLGHRKALTRLGELLSVGIPELLQQDTSEAARLLGMADRQADPDASYALAVLLLKETRQDALEVLLRAANRGHPKACFQVAEYYREGISVQKDMVRSFEYTKWAAHQGDPQALSNLGHLFVNGIGAPKDERKAARLFRQAAISGSPEGEMNWALVLLRGTGGTQIDHLVALKWAKKSAAQGHQLAIKQLPVIQNLAKTPSPPARSRPECEDDLRYLSIKELRELLQEEGIDFSDVFEKSGLIARAASVLLQEDRWDPAPDLEVPMEFDGIYLGRVEDYCHHIRAHPFLDSDEDDFEICD